MMLGRVDEVDGHFVATKFFAFVIPTECVYVARGSTRARADYAPHEALRIKLQWHSILCAYARVGFAAVALALLCAAFLYARQTRIALVASGALIAASAIAFGSGYLTEAEKERLRLLGTVTGLRIDPSKLLPSTRSTKLASLAKLMAKAGIPTTARDLFPLLDDLPPPAMPLVYGYARYAGDDAAWRDCAELVYARCDLEA
jgi:hypothetical protein